MTFRLKRKESVADGIRRILLEQLDQAATQLGDATNDRHEAIHRARQCMKKMRAVLRLVRRGAETSFEHENRTLRDAARRLSDLRDAEALIETFDKSRADFGEEHAEDLDRWRGVLIGRRDAIVAGETDLERRIDEARQALEDMRSRLGEHPIRRKGFGAVGRGLRSTYSSGRRAMGAVRRSGTSAQYHEWRKQAKYLRYQTLVLQGVWPGLMLPLHRRLKKLSDLLGEHHDLTVLRELALAEPAAFGGEAAAARLLELIENRRGRIENRVAPLGGRIYAESAKDFERRIGRYWTVWQD